MNANLVSEIEIFTRVWGLITADTAAMQFDQNGLSISLGIGWGGIPCNAVNAWIASLLVSTTDENEARVATTRLRLPSSPSSIFIFKIDPAVEVLSK